MMGALLLSALLAAQEPAVAQEPAPAPSGVRSFVATITSDKGGAVTGLDANDVAVIENGVARDLVSIDADLRPVTLAFIIDTSEATRAALRLNVVEAATTFLKGLPEGSTFAIWSTGDRPTKVLDYTSNRVEGQKALARLFPRGGNTLLDAVPEASVDLGKQGEKGDKKEGERPVVVVLTGLTPDFSHRDKFRAAEEAEKKVGLLLAVSYEEGDADFEDRQKYDYVLSTLSKQSGGRYETVLSPMSVTLAMGKLLEDLKSQYQVTYVSAPDLKDKDRKVEVKVARPGVRVRVGRSKIS